jgi:branched-subunit amino acid permease|tara:strand:- start:228 stop:536 length:309 start_codon:yes stop_codon:yes gene_type:complete
MSLNKYINLIKKFRYSKMIYPLFLLIIPLLGMLITDEFDWTIFDFIIMGIILLLLGIGINFISNQKKSIQSKTIYIGLLISMFLIIWAELAVGVFGSPFAGS